MKNEFIGFYKLEESDYKTLWEKAIFVFDANVLLSLYRYRIETSNELIGVMERLTSRVWIPYHAALEYQRNRLTVIAKQNTRFSEVRKVINSVVSKLEGDLGQLDLIKRHSTINTDTLLADIRGAIEKFTPLLDAFEVDHFRLNGDDRIRERLENIFDGKIGPKPAGQDEIVGLEKIADGRFKKKIPPGYMDNEKEKSGTAEFTYGGINYQRKYGDYFIWEQMISFADKANLTDLIFVTDDNKEDWLLKINQEGEQTIGPRPELTEELARRTPVKRFNIYSSAKFLEHANRFLSEHVSEQAIKDATEVAQNQSTKKRYLNAYEHDAQRAFLSWLSDRYGSENIAQPQKDSRLDAVAMLGGKNIGFHIKATMGREPNIHNLKKLARSLSAHPASEVDETVLVIIVSNTDILKNLEQLIGVFLSKIASIQIILGAVFYSEGEFFSPYFVPYNYFDGASISAYNP